MIQLSRQFLPQARLLQLLIVTLSLLPSLALVDIIELGVDNFYNTITSQPWTCILFYDRLDEDNYQKNHQLLLQTLKDELPNIDVAIAQFDIRRHSAYREAYYRSPDGPFSLSNFYRGFPDEALDLLVISHRSFMTGGGGPYFSSQLVWMGSDFNAYGTLELDKITGDASLKASVASAWLQGTLQELKNTEDLEHRVLRRNPLEKHQRRMDHSNEEIKVSESLREEFQKEVQSAKTDNLRLALETVANSNADEDNDSDEEISFYTYPLLSLEDYQGTPRWLEELSYVIDRYLIWVEGYEIQWDPERKQREDTQCEFGTHLETMNRQIRDLVDRVFESDGAPRALKAYLDDLVFGYGRSPSSLQWYLVNQVRHRLGADAATRKQNRKAASTLPLFERLRGYMKILLDASKDEALYQVPISQLVTEWHNLMVQFHANLNQSYQKYLSSTNSKDDKVLMPQRQSIEVLDMEDLANHNLLSDYDAFHHKYTRTQTPVILGNVQLITGQPKNLTFLEYLAQECGGMDVSHKIRISRDVLDKAGTGWGGLKKFLLSDYSSDSDDDDEDIVALEQFLKLQQQLDHLYLHDFGLPDHCPSLLYEDTLYGPQQKFQIPSIVASYDLFHRVSLSGFDSSWPSLFLGKKGSNSKIHIDRSATGFFMYLVAGRKRWIVTHPSERVFLYQSIDYPNFIPDVLGIDKSPEANQFLKKRFPLLERMEATYEVIQEPGQLIYIPPDSPHAVENLDDTIGVALNLVPRDAFGRHIHDLIHLDREFGHVEVALKYWLYEETADRPMSTKDPLYMTFAEYNGQT